MVTTADLTAANGVVHVIDAVLFPSTEMSINESIILEENSKYLYSIDILGKKSIEIQEVLSFLTSMTQAKF